LIFGACLLEGITITDFAIDKKKSSNIRLPFGAVVTMAGALLGPFHEETQILTRLLTSSLTGLRSQIEASLKKKAK
jgi:hypothetical protein